MADNIDYDKLLGELLKKPNVKAKRKFARWQVNEPNAWHQIDILFLSGDTSRPGRKIEYALTLIDVASRYKASRPLRNKSADEMLKQLKDIYEKDDYLKIPKVLQSDDGGEFKGAVKRWCKDENIKQIVNQKGFHLSFVESFNGNLAKELYKVQQKKELKENRPYTNWIDILQDTIKRMNNTKTRLIKMKPIDAIQMNEVPQPKTKLSNADKEKKFELGTRVRRLLNKDEFENLANGNIKIEKRRATDTLWSMHVYVVEMRFKLNDVYYHTLKPVESVLGKGKSLDNAFTFWQLADTSF